MSAERVIETVLPSVVSISVQVDSNGIQSTSSVSGTGFFVSEDGLIMTNKHVISQVCGNPSSTQNLVLATDYQNKAYELQLVTVDPTSDLALMKVKDRGSNSFTKVNFYPSDQIKLGMPVIAIGNALGELKNTVTAGIISGTNRNVSSSDNSNLNTECGGYSAFDDGLIQTDAAINSGNSGGPLFSRTGLLIGVNTFNSPTAQSIGLAIPGDDVARSLGSYVKNGKITKPYLGVSTRNVTDTLQKQNPWLPVNYGALIAPVQNSVVKDSAAAKAGLLPGDIILAIEGEEIRPSDANSSALRKALNKFDPGAKIKLRVLKTRAPLLRDPNAQVTSKLDYEPNPIEVEVVLGALDSPVK